MNCRDSTGSTTRRQKEILDREGLNLEKCGLVRRVRDPNDRRKRFIQLKREGKRLVDELLAELTEMISVSLDGISQRDMKVFWKVVHQIEANLFQMAQGDTVVD